MKKFNSQRNVNIEQEIMDLEQKKQSAGFLHRGFGKA